MSSLRGSQYLWNAAPVVLNGVSNLAIPGPGPYLSLYVTSDTACTLTVQAAVSASPEPGRNALTSAADGGLTWYDYFTKDDPSTATTVVLTANQAHCLDLSPYGPEFVRLKATTLTGTATITALVSSFGPN